MARMTAARTPEPGATRLCSARKAGISVTLREACPIIRPTITLSPQRTPAAFRGRRLPSRSQRLRRRRSLHIILTMPGTAPIPMKRYSRRRTSTRTVLGNYLHTQWTAMCMPRRLSRPTSQYPARALTTCFMSQPKTTRSTRSTQTTTFPRRIGLTTS